MVHIWYIWEAVVCSRKRIIGRWVTKLFARTTIQIGMPEVHSHTYTPQYIGAYSFKEPIDVFVYLCRYISNIPMYVSVHFQLYIWDISKQIECNV